MHNAKLIAEKFVEMFGSSKVIQLKVMPLRGLIKRRAYFPRAYARG